MSESDATREMPIPQIGDPAAPGSEQAPEEASERGPLAPPVHAPATEVAPDEQAPLAAFIEINGPGDGSVTPISGGMGTIGRRSEELTLRLPYDQWVSREHAQVVYRQGQWVLEDLKSSNGTWLEDGRRRVREATPIVVGQVFRVGHTDLLLTEDRTLILRQVEPA